MNIIDDNHRVVLLAQTKRLLLDFYCMQNIAASNAEAAQKLQPALAYEWIRVVDCLHFIHR